MMVIILLFYSLAQNDFDDLLDCPNIGITGNFNFETEFRLIFR